jgi:hypothetical protein
MLTYLQSGSTLSLILLCLGAPVGALAQDTLSPLAETSSVFGLVDNGDMREAYEGPDARRQQLIPWWRLQGEARVMAVDGGVLLETPVGSRASQPISAYGPLAANIRVVGVVHGVGRVELRDGAGGLFAREVGAPGVREEFAILGREIEVDLGRKLQPRLVLSVGPAGETPARWGDLQAWVPLPCPSETVLRAAVVERLQHIFGAWLELGRPPGGVFIQRSFDVVTGDPLRAEGGEIFEFPGGFFPLFSFLLAALEYEDDPVWRAAFESFLESYLEHCLDETTHLPRRWVSAEQRADGNRFREIAADLEFLIDVSEVPDGTLPQALKARAFDAALAMGGAILERGILPDGTVVASYRAVDGAVNLSTNPLRRLDVPAQLARLGALAGNAVMEDAARNALAAFEFTHHWPGNWHDVDPGFDDDFGHYGARAVTMLSAFPDDAGMGALVDEGWAHYRDMWGDCLRMGGSVAADQIRCWKLMLQRVSQKPELGPELRPLLSAAMRAHFKAQQYRNGAFGDVTFLDFDPKTGIQVGDLPGAPANLLLGLGLCYGEPDTLEEDRVRAMAATLLITSDEHYRREYGYLLGQRETLHFNSAGGGLRLCPALITWLRRLDR